MDKDQRIGDLTTVHIIGLSVILRFNDDNILAVSKTPVISESSAVSSSRCSVISVIL